MTDQEKNELLLRLDINQKNMIETISRIELRLETRPCDTNSERIRSIEWIVRTALGASILAMIKAFWPNGG